jgi:prepilin-type N-terminal cleavage/methylation domain-containing protein
MWLANFENWSDVYCFSTMNMKMKKNFRRLSGQAGFTLLELLVVIGIIGVIMALATVAYSSVQISGRNTRRKQDLVAIQNSLEQYYSVNEFKYPSGSCKEAATFLKSAWPVDPGSSADYTGVNTCIENWYCICAAMEGSGTGGNSAENCNWNAGVTHYCVGNLQ